MATTLPKGNILPDDGDPGSVWFTALESNIQRADSHNHNNTNSERLDTSATVALTDALPAGSWADDGTGTGTFEQTVAKEGIDIESRWRFGPKT